MAFKWTLYLLLVNPFTDKGKIDGKKVQSNRRLRKWSEDITLLNILKQKTVFSVD